MHYCKNYSGWVRPVAGYEFFTPKCQALCEEAAVLAGRNIPANCKAMVNNRVALLREHLRLCHDPERVARFNKTIAYQLSLLADPQAVFCRFPA